MSIRCIIGWYLKYGMISGEEGNGSEDLHWGIALNLGAKL